MSQGSVEGHSESTGDPRVDGVVARLDGLDGLDLPARLELFGDLHTSLATILDTPQDLDGDSDPDHAALTAS